MFISEAVRPAAANPSQRLAWPVIGARRSMFGTSLGAGDDVRALQQIGIKLRVMRLSVGRYGRHLSIDAQQLVYGHLRRANRILHREDDIVRNFHELADEREIFRAK